MDSSAPRDVGVVHGDKHLAFRDVPQHPLELRVGEVGESIYKITNEGEVIYNGEVINADDAKMAQMFREFIKLSCGVEVRHA